MFLPPTPHTATMTKGVVLIPRHCSDRLNHALIVSLNENQKEIEPFIVVQCHKAGVVWRGLYPLLFESPPHVANKALRILTRRFRSGRLRTCRLQLTDEDVVSTTHFSRSRMRLVSCNLFCILPPNKTPVDYDFSGRLIHLEHIWLQMQTLSAYFATLGGGFFLCRRLSTAIQLARRQRWVATWMGDHAMADRCTLNEAYNYLHAGQFHVAFAMLKALKASARARNDIVLFNMCKSARLLGKRMKRAGKRGANAARNTVDDYQRIRIVGKL